MAPSAHTVPATILVVDDDTAIQNLLSIILQRRGYRVLTSGTAADGLAQLAGHQAELVLMDYQLPDRDGLSALMEIKAQ